MKNRWPTMLLGGLLIAALGSVVMITTTVLGNRTQVAASEGLAQPAQQAASQAATIEGPYGGAVDLAWVVSGVYSDTLTAPPPPAEGAPAAPDLGSIHLLLQLSQSGNAVRGYVRLEQVLTFSVVHTLTDGTKTGPNVSGTLNGANLTLTSERFVTTLDSKSFTRQFRLTGQVDTTADSLSGEYRETLWGYGEEPYTISGRFTLPRLSAANKVIGTSNQAPLTAVDAVTTSQGKAVTINVLANDSDADGDALTVTGVSKPQFGAATNNAQSVTYTPNADFVGEDQFTYFVSDGKDGTAAGTIRVTVNGPNGPNRAPTASNDTAATKPGVAVTINVLANDVDPDGDVLSVAIESQPSHGTATVQAAQIVYTPAAGFMGTDTFRYSVVDGKGGTAIGTVTVTVSENIPSGGAIYLPLIAR